MSRFESLDTEWPSYEATVSKKVSITCQDKIFTSFLCALSKSSALVRFIHMYCGTGYTTGFYHVPNVLL